MSSLRSLQEYAGAPEPAAADDPLLCFAGRIAGCHALVLGPESLDVLCRLLRHGCAAATCLRGHERPEHGAFDLVVLPHAEAASAGAMVCLAKRALVPGGRFVARAADGGVVLWRTLQLAGFGSVRREMVPGGVVLRGDAPAERRAAA